MFRHFFNSHEQICTLERCVQDASWRPVKKIYLRTLSPTMGHTGLTVTVGIKTEAKIMNYIGDRFHIVWELILWCEEKGVMWITFSFLIWWLNRCRVFKLRGRERFIEKMNIFDTLVLFYLRDLKLKISGCQLSTCIWHSGKRPNLGNSWIYWLSSLREDSFNKRKALRIEPWEI